MTVLMDLDLAYLPPYGSAKDPVNGGMLTLQAALGDRAKDVIVTG